MMAPASESTIGVAPASLLLETDGSLDFPWAGAGLLLLLVFVAMAARWRAFRGGALNLRLRQTGAQSTTALRVSATTRLNPQTEVHVVHWEGKRLLVASTLNTPAVVLASHQESS